MKAIARILAFLSFASSVLLFFRPRSPAQNLSLGILKIVAGTLSPYLALVGVAGSALGLLTRAPWTAALAAIGAFLFARHVRAVTAPHDGFARTFGADWQGPIPPQRELTMLQKRWSWRLSPIPTPCWERDIPFCTIPGTERKLLCDLWLPAQGVKKSGLAFIYFHGGDWHYMDKDFGTRPFFRHLAAQGHVVMDVANRLCPEVDIRGQVHDVKRALAWMKDQVDQYGVDAQRIVLGGGSSGGNIALLAAYAPHHLQLTPEDLKDEELSVRGVVSYYGPTDLRAYYRHAGLTVPDTEASVRTVARLFKIRAYTHTQMMINMAGGLPDQAPEMVDLMSLITHAGAHCPPTLLLQGEHDSTTSAQAWVLFLIVIVFTVILFKLSGRVVYYGGK